MTVAYLGPQGTFSEEAAAKHFGGRRACSSRARRSTRCSARSKPAAAGYGVVPVENSTRRRGRPHARSAARDAAQDLRRSDAADPPMPDDPESASSRPSARCIRTRRAWRSATQWLARRAARRGAYRGRQQRRGGAARGAQRRGAAAIGRRVAAALYGLEDARAQHRGRAEQHDALPGDCRRAMPRPSGKDKTSLVMSARNRARRGARAADAARAATA